jgi:hypothetical protein
LKEFEAAGKEFYRRERERFQARAIGHWKLIKPDKYNTWKLRRTNTWEEVS